MKNDPPPWYTAQLVYPPHIEKAFNDIVNSGAEELAKTILFLELFGKDTADSKETEN